MAQLSTMGFPHGGWIEGSCKAWRACTGNGDLIFWDAAADMAYIPVVVIQTLAGNPGTAWECRVRGLSR